MVVVFVLTFGSLGFLVFSLVASIRKEQTRKVWANFSLSLSLMILFFGSWVGHGIAQWQRYTDEQLEHSQPAEVGNFVSDFAASTLENWQSEFLQLFSFVTLAALYIHKGSAESKDNDEEVMRSLKRIEEKIGSKG